MATLIGRLHGGGGRFWPPWLGGVGVRGGWHFFRVTLSTFIPIEVGANNGKLVSRHFYIEWLPSGDNR